MLNATLQTALLGAMQPGGHQAHDRFFAMIEKRDALPEHDQRDGGFTFRGFFNRFKGDQRDF